MTTYSKETALYDTGAISTGIANAEKTATNYLSVDSSGIMVYDGSNGTQTPSSPSANTRNVFIDENSVDVRKGTTTLASFGTETVIKTTDGTELAYFGYDEGEAETGTDIKPYYTFGKRRSDSEKGNYSFASGHNTTASGYMSHADGAGSIASGKYSHACGLNSQAIGDHGSFASGYGSQAYGNSSFSAGSHTVASSDCETALGKYNTNDYRLETFVGDGVTQTFYLNETAQFLLKVTVDGSTPSSTSHTGNRIDISPTPSQGSTIEIAYSISNYALVIGNGLNNSNRSNALTVDWNGGIRTTPEFISTNVASTKGTYVSSTCYRFGQVVCLYLVFYNASSIAAGADIYTATFTSTLPRPIFRITGASYYGLHTLTGALTTSRGVSIRNSSSTAVSISGSNTAGISFTYITND